MPGGKVDPIRLKKMVDTLPFKIVSELTGELSEIVGIDVHERFPFLLEAVSRNIPVSSLQKERLPAENKKNRNKPTHLSSEPLIGVKV